jgi:signal transduction histidine kinase
MERDALITLSESLDLGRSNLLHEFEKALCASGSSLFFDRESLGQILGQADRAISDVIYSLRREGGDPLHREGADERRDRRSLRLSRSAGLRRAENGVHPNESLQLAGAFFEIMTTAIGALTTPDAAGIAAGFAAVKALNHSLTTHMREAAISYSEFLLQRINAGQFSERTLLSREIHDRVGSDIAVAHQNLELGALLLECDPERARAQIAKAQQAIDQSSQNIRLIVSGLRGRPRSSGSLRAALEEFVESFNISTTATAIDVTGRESWVSDDVLDEVFMAVREALRNALTYATADTVQVRVDIQPTVLRVVVADDGRGFDPVQAMKEPTSRGLLSIRERIALVGGSVSISSRPDAGTTVTAAVPLPAGA